MDKVTQSNAANAEESASASEELSAQAQQMNAMVQELVALVRGGDAVSMAGAASKAVQRKSSAPAGGGRLRAPSQHALHHGADRKKAGPSAYGEEKKLVKPSDVIPLSDDDFKDF